ncbi:VanW family protein [Nocardioides panacis]|uniref:VanW family protein n=1 Tax=Nocardioides panacis TaxID=2849501 RepID=A0A975SYX7_9ACTN|nr:VanW family protein [Nocardioides panacis]QWZ08519.1 VanW family protein [Nocardioides panacis]
MSDEPYRTSDRRVIPALMLGLVALFGAVYVAGYFFTSDRIPRGTTVSGVEIGGLTPVAAQARLRTGLEQRATDPVRVVANGEPASIDPTGAGLSVDVPATVAQSGGGRSWEPGRMWDYFAGGSDEDAVVRVDRDALDRAVAEVADEVDVPAVEGSVAFAGGEAVAKYPEKGTVVDRDAAADAVTGAFLGAGDPVELPTVEADPQVGKDAVSRAMEGFANPAVSASVVVALAGEGVSLQPEDFTPALSMTPVDGELEPVLDGAVLVDALGPRMRTIARSPRDASFRIVRGVPEVVPSRVGVTFDPADVTGRFLDVLTRTGADRRLDVASVEAPPDFTTEAANALGVTERVSSFTTSFPYASYRNQNLGRAAELIDGTLLKPGDTFSLNDTVGERTAANGFTKGFVISDGVFREDFGGGVSQVATTTFNAAFFAGLEDVEHKPHSFYIDRYPVGREATVAWGAVDLRFRNTTPYGVYVRASVDPSSPSRQGAMHVSMYSTKYWDIKAEQSARYNETAPETRQLSGPECVPNTGYGGFDIDVYRLFYKAGSSKLDHRETMHTRYTPSDSVVCS